MQGSFSGRQKRRPEHSSKDLLRKCWNQQASSVSVLLPVLCWPNENTDSGLEFGIGNSSAVVAWQAPDILEAWAGPGSQHKPFLQNEKEWGQAVVFLLPDLSSSQLGRNTWEEKSRSPERNQILPGRLIMNFKPLRQHWFDPFVLAL